MNENATEKIMDKLSNDEFDNVRYAVALNEKTNEKTLDKLSKDEDVNVRKAVAMNENTSIETLKKLTKDESPSVKIALFKNEKLTGELIDLIAKGKLNSMLVQLIIENKNTSINTLFNMSGSLSKEVNESDEEDESNEQINLLNKIEKILESKIGNTDENGWNEVNKFIDNKVNNTADEETLESVARSNFVHPETLKKVFEKTNKESIKTAIARNSNVSEEILAKLANDPDEKVRIEVARNPKTSSSILTKLSNDKSIEVRKLIAQNKNTSQEVLSKLSTDENIDVKMCVIENDATPMDILKKMTKDKKVGQKANLQIKRRNGEAIVTDKDKEYVQKYYTSSGDFRTYDFITHLYGFDSIRNETYAEHGISSLNESLPNIESKINYFSGSGYKGSNAKKLALLAAYHFGFEKGDFRTDYKKEPPPDPKEVEEYARYLKIEQDILRKSGLVTKDGKVRLFRNVGESLFRYHKEDDPIQYSTYKQHYGATMEYRGSHIECWTFKPDLHWEGAKIYAEVPIEAVIGSFIGRGGTGDSYQHNSECECTICTTDFVKEVRLVGSDSFCIPEVKNGYLYDVKSQYGSNSNDYEMYVMPISEEDKQEFEKLYNSKNPEDRKEALNNPLISKELIQKMFEKEKDNSVLAEIAGNPKTPVDVLKNLISNDNFEVQKELLLNPNFPIPELDNLLKSTKHDEIKNIINEKLEEKKKKELEEIKNGTIFSKQSVASNPNTTLDVLKMLSEDESDYVKKSVADNPNCPSDILDKLSESNNEHIYKAIAENPNVSSSTLLKIADKTEDDKVKNAIIKNKNASADVLNEIFSKNSNNFNILSLLLQNKNITDEIAVGAAKYNNSMLDGYLLGNKNTSNEALDTIAKNKMNIEGQSYILKKISEHPNCFTSTMKEMLKYNLDNDSRRMITENLNNKLKAIGNTISDEEPTPEDIQELKEHFPESCKGKSMQELIILFKTLAKRGFFSAPSSTPEEPEQTEDDEADEILKYLDMGDYSKDEQEIDDYFKKYL